MEELEDEDSGDEDELEEEDDEGGDREFVEADSDLEDEMSDMEDWSGDDDEEVSCDRRVSRSSSCMTLISTLPSLQYDSDEDDEEQPSDSENSEGDDDEPSVSDPKGKRKAAPQKPAAQPPKKAKKIGGSGPRVEIEYEQETEPLSKDMLANW